MRRRQFLENCGYGLTALLAARDGTARAADDLWPGPELAADIVIVGGGLGGCAAALAALRAGRTVILTEPTDWVGGQLTSQAVPPDEHPWIEQFGSNSSYRVVREGIREYYRRHYRMTPEARREPPSQPGQWQCVETVPRTTSGPGGPDRFARPLLFEPPVAAPSRT